MDVDSAVEISRQAVVVALMVGAPVMIAAVIVGLLISILQAVTQLQDQTLSFVPKIAVMLLTMLYVMPWAMSRMIEYTTDLFHSIPGSL